MKIQISEIGYLYEKGKRENNEDAIYPKENETNLIENLFIVCDGVGGMDKGEVASQLICDSFAKYFKKYEEDYFDLNFLKKAFQFVQEELNYHQNKYPETKGMASTLTLLFFNKEGAWAMHCGDSRIYHFRDKKIIGKTRDHSWVNEMLDRGHLTPEEAKNHRRKHIITRAMQGTENKTEADIKLIKDIKKDDYFFLSTDGVHDFIEESKLLEIICSTKNKQEKINAIAKICKENSKDNYSAFLLKIGDVQKNKDEFLSKIISFFKSKTNE